MDKPSQVLPSVSTSTPSPLPLQIPDPSVLGSAWDQILKQRGIRFLHQRNVPCPNMSALDIHNHEPGCSFCDNSGRYYYDSKTVTGVFYSNSLEKQFEKQGIWEIGTAMASFPTEYDDGSQCEFAIMDRLTCLDYTVRLWEMKAYEPAASGTTRMRYPIQKIEIIMSIKAGIVKEYLVDVDFTIDNGRILWVAGKEPSYNTTTETGEVLSVSYYAYPVFSVAQTLREMRVTQELTAGQKVARRLPQQVLLKRDYLPQASEKVASLE
jgi:hypothetical protein